jgi:hypothetical protein
MTHGKNLPKEVIDRWPEVFGEIKLNVVPLRYLRSVRITFKSDRVWEIDIDSDASRNWENFETQIKDIVAQYEDSIENIDFKLDTDRIKKDIKKHTNKFLKNKQLK